MCSDTTTATTTRPESNLSPDAIRERHAVAEVSIESGPECTGKVSLADGRHVIGRSSSAHIRISDVTLGLHHAVIDIEPGSVTVTQLSGQAPIRIDGVPVIGTRTAAFPVRLSIGMHEVQIDPASTTESHPAEEVTGRLVAMPNDPGTRILRRGRDRPMTPPADPIVPPTPAVVQRVLSATASIGVACGVAGAGVIAGMLGHTVLALVAALGAVASATTWLVGAMATGKRNGASRRIAEEDRRRFLDDLAVACIGERQRHLVAHPGLGKVIAIAEGLTDVASVRSDVWQRRLVRPTDADTDNEGADVTFRPVIGIGSSRWSPPVVGDLSSDTITDVDCAATIGDVPVPVALASGSVTAISGGRTARDALVRSILCQMAVRHGPADWQLVIVSSAGSRWAWVDGFPHAHTSTGTMLIADPADPDDLATVLMLADGPSGRPTLLVVDDPDLFAMQDGALRWFMQRAKPATLTTIDVGAPRPAMCTAFIEIGSTGAVMTTRLDGTTDDLADAASAIRMSGLSTERGERIARSMAGLVDPEVDGCSAAR